MCSASQEIRVTRFAQPTVNPLACCICWAGLLGCAVFPPWNKGPNFGSYTGNENDGNYHIFFNCSVLTLIDHLLSKIKEISGIIAKGRELWKSRVEVICHAYTALKIVFSIWLKMKNETLKYDKVLIFFFFPLIQVFSKSRTSKLLEASHCG